MPEEDAGGAALGHQRMGESLGLLILAADALGLPQTKAALQGALRRLDREAEQGANAGRPEPADRPLLAGTEG